MKKMQKGFTLIELMIVVAVIGVLSAIAVPQYQKYVEKSAVGAALASVTAYRTQIEDNIAFSNSFPAIDETFGIGTIKSTSAALGTNTIVAAITKGSGTGSKVTLTRDNTNGKWTCTHDATGIEITGCN